MDNSLDCKHSMKERTLLFVSTTTVLVLGSWVPLLPQMAPPNRERLDSQALGHFLGSAVRSSPITRANTGRTAHVFTSQGDTKLSLHHSLQAPLVSWISMPDIVDILGRSIFCCNAVYGCFFGGYDWKLLCLPLLGLDSNALEEMEIVTKYELLLGRSKH